MIQAAETLNCSLFDLLNKPVDEGAYWIGEAIVYRRWVNDEQERAMKKAKAKGRKRG